MRRRRERRENRRQWRCCNRLRNLISHPNGEGEAVGTKPEVRITVDASKQIILRTKGDSVMFYRKFVVVLGLVAAFRHPAVASVSITEDFSTNPFGTWS